MPDEVGRHPIFDSWYGRSSEWGPDGKWSASFGGNVLGAVTSALDDYLALRDFASQRRQPAVLGCSPWLSRPQRLWLGSANLTNNSRRGLEFGIWTDDASLVDLGRGFLSDLLTYSEPLSSYQPRAVPERIPYEFDDAAFYEYFRELEEGRLRESREGAVDSARACS